MSLVTISVKSYLSCSHTDLKNALHPFSAPLPSLATWTSIDRLFAQSSLDRLLGGGFLMDTDNLLVAPWNVACKGAESAIETNLCVDPSHALLVSSGDTTRAEKNVHLLERQLLGLRHC